MLSTAPQLCYKNGTYEHILAGQRSPVIFPQLQGACADLQVASLGLCSSFFSHHQICVIFSPYMGLPILEPQAKCAGHYMPYYGIDALSGCFDQFKNWT